MKRLPGCSGGQRVICSIPGCGRPTMRSSGVGLAEFHCRYHVQFKARHGSHWCPTYRAADLRPYLAAAGVWIAANAGDGATVGAWRSLGDLLCYAGRVDPAMNLRSVPAAQRARVAFARLREAGIGPERLLSIWLGVSALIEDDRGSHRVREFRIVQAAKAAHRLASGTHRRWDMWQPGGGTVPIAVHAYPKSSGLVLRRIGEAMEEACQYVPRTAVAQIIIGKTERFGLHPSRLPGWRPAWDTRHRSAG